MRRLRWESPRSIPRRPYRDSAVFYAILAALIVGIAAATGGRLAYAAVVATVFFVVATGWSWRRWRSHVQEQGGRR